MMFKCDSCNRMRIDEPADHQKELQTTFPGYVFENGNPKLCNQCHEKIRLATSEES